MAEPRRLPVLKSTYWCSRLLAWAVLCLSSGVALPHDSPYTVLRFQSLTVADGLSNGAVNAIIQDQRGFMWFGTEDGLNRYDGKQFVIYRNIPGDSDSIASANFGALLEDRSGHLWLGTWGAGLDRLDLATGEIVHFGTGVEQNHGFRGSNIEFVFQDSKGAVWIGTERQGLNRYDAVTETFEHFPAVAAGTVRDGNQSAKAIAESVDGQLFIGTDAGLFVFDRGARLFLPVELPGDVTSGKDRIRSLHADKQGSLWVGTRGDGLKRLDIASGAWTEYRRNEDGGLSENSIARVFVDSAGIVWIATYNSGLDRLDTATGQVTNFDYTSEENVEGIIFRRIDAIFEDRSGMLWFGTRGGGINKLPVRPRGFKSYKYADAKPHGLPHPTVRSIAGQKTAGSELIWIGTDGGGLARLDTAAEHFQSVSVEGGLFPELENQRVWAVHVDRRDRVWVGTYSSGLYMKQAGDKSPAARHFTYTPERAQGISSNRVQALLETMNGSIWVGTQGGLDRLLSLEGPAKFEHYRHDPSNPRSLSHSEITALLEADAKHLWVGTRSGLNLLNRVTGDAERFFFDVGNPGSLSGNYVTSLWRDREGRLWVGTDNGGLNRYLPAEKTFENYPGISDQAGLRISSILPGENNTLWLGTGRGLIHFNPEDSSAKTYGTADGLVTMSFLRGAAYASGAGELYLGGLRGMVSFKAGRISQNSRPPDMAITSIRRFDTGEELLQAPAAIASEAIELAHDEAFLRIEYAALDYSDPARNQYAHRLEGIDSDWVYTGNENFASYANLAPGRYLFSARAANADGVWNEVGVRSEIVVLPAYWQTWWFRLLVIGLLAVLVYGLHRARTGGIRSQNIKLEELNMRLLDQIRARSQIESERETLIAELEERNAEMERFTYTVSHDLKSPLITIKGFLGLLREHAANSREDDVQRDIGKIESATTRMNQLLEELLQFSRAGKPISSPEPVDLGELAQEALSLAQGEIQAADARVKVHDKLPVLRLDRMRMLEVLLNLVSNATRFMGDQPHPEIEIGMRHDGGVPVFFVRDNGIGIELPHHEKIFTLFERLDSQTPGTGIGLALAKRIIENHHGRIWVESEGAGKGATFCFTLNENDVFAVVGGKEAEAV